MTTKTYVKFTEQNDQEGETWTFWLPVEGNERALAGFADWLAQQGDRAEEYTLDLEAREPEERVDALVEHGGSGYMAYHTKVSGLMSGPMPDGPDRLYKGGVRGFFA